MKRSEIARASFATSEEKEKLWILRIEMVFLFLYSEKNIALKLIYITLTIQKKKKKLTKENFYI